MPLGSPYLVLLTIGLTVGCLWFLRRGRAQGLLEVALIDVCIAAVIGGMVGSRALHVAVEPLPGHVLDAGERAELERLTHEVDPERDPAGRAALEAALAGPAVHAPWLFVARMPPGAAREAAIERARADPDDVPAWLWYRARPLEALAFWKGGLAYVGGLALAVALCAGVIRRHGLSFPAVADVAAPAIVLGLIFGRLGCFVGGCCYGEVCEPHWWSTPPSWYPPPVGGVPRYPTALMAAGFAAALFAALRALLARRAFPGEVILAMLALYAPGRFAIEALRADPRGGAGGLSTSQIAALATGLPAAALWLALRLRARGAEAASPPVEQTPPGLPPS